MRIYSHYQNTLINQKSWNNLTLAINFLTIIFCYRLFFVYVGFSRDIRVRIIYKLSNTESSNSENQNNLVLILGNSIGTTSFLPRETIHFGLGWKMR